MRLYTLFGMMVWNFKSIQTPKNSCPHKHPSRMQVYILNWLLLVTIYIYTSSPKQGPFRWRNVPSMVLVWDGWSPPGELIGHKKWEHFSFPLRRPKNPRVIHICKNTQRQVLRKNSKNRGRSWIQYVYLHGQGCKESKIPKLKLQNPC